MATILLSIRKREPDKAWQFLDAWGLSFVQQLDQLVPCRCSEKWLVGFDEEVFFSDVDK